MKEERRGPGGSEGGRDLLRDQPALAHAGDDHPAGAGDQRLHRAIEALPQIGDEIQDGLGFDLEDASRRVSGHLPES
jgi:hypothetical protein